MSHDDMDPEVRADLELRERLAASRPRVSDGQFAEKIREAAKPRIIERVPCRNRCGAVADWTEEAEQAFMTFNHKLASAAEAPLDKTRIVFCPSCARRLSAESSQRNRMMVNKIGDAIRELKAGCPPRREDELLDKLERSGHPDIAGLKQWLKDNVNDPKKRRAQKQDF
jgi:hypothetical protein